MEANLFKPCVLSAQVGKKSKAMGKAHLDLKYRDKI